MTRVNYISFIAIAHRLGGKLYSEVFSGTTGVDSNSMEMQYLVLTPNQFPFWRERYFLSLQAVIFLLSVLCYFLRDSILAR